MTPEAQFRLRLLDSGEQAARRLRARLSATALLLTAMLLVPTSALAQIPTQVVEYYHTDALGSVRAVTKQVNGEWQVVARHDFMPFGEEVAAPTPPQDKRLFTGKERDNETGLDYFAARYLRTTHGRFTTIDPAMTVKENMLDPQRWNRYAYVKSNPLKFADPDGRELKPVGDLALVRVRSTVPEALRAAIVVGADGLLDKAAINAAETTDANFLDLRTIVNDPGVMQVVTAAGADLTGKGPTPFHYTPQQEVIADLAKYGVPAASVTGPELFLGLTSGAPGRVVVTLSDGAGLAGKTPSVEHAVTAAHEMYGHGLLMLKGRPSAHEKTYPKGPVNERVKAIEDRTRRLYDQQN